MSPIALVAVSCILLSRAARYAVDMSASSVFRVVGIDPGLNITGYGAVDFGNSLEPSIVEAGTLRTTHGRDLADRILQLHSDLVALLDDLRPDTVVIEQLYAHYKHPRTSILMAHARGIILLACRQAGISVHSVSATHVKKSLTGNGHATKLQMQRSIQAICKLSELPQPPDVADAIAIALCGGRRYARQ